MPIRVFTLDRSGVHVRPIWAFTLDRYAHLGHPANGASDVRGNRRAAGPAPLALPGPVPDEASPMPAEDRLGLDDGDDLRPAAPQAGEQNPEQAVGGA